VQQPFQPLVLNELKTGTGSRVNSSVARLGDRPEQGSDERGEPIEAGSHLIFVQTDVVDSLIQRGVTIEVLQLDKVHPGFVSEATESPAQIVMRDPQPQTRKAGPIGYSTQENVRAGLRERNYHRILVRVPRQGSQHIRGFGEHREHPPLAAAPTLPEHVKPLPAKVDVLRSQPQYFDSA